MRHETRGECPSRRPIRYEINQYNWMLIQNTPDHRDSPTALDNATLFGQLLAELQEDRPHLVLGMCGNFGVAFYWGWCGALAGQLYRVFGDWTQGNAPPTGQPRLTRDEVAQRIDTVEAYVRALHHDGRVARLVPYMDLGTQIFGRHDRPAAEPPSAWGFWDFYDHWDEYAQPSGPFDLGPRPPDPTDWLARWHDPAGFSRPGLPSELRGFSFSYGPVKPAVYGPHYRYSVCQTSAGWRLWWKQVVQWIARLGYDGAFVDNAYFTNCWNDDCQRGYREWLSPRYTHEEIDRWFTLLPNNLLQPLEGWVQDGAGRWLTPYWSEYPTVRGVIHPDGDGIWGRYSCRIEPAGSPATFSHVSTLIPVDTDWRLTFWYRTEGDVASSAVITYAVTPTLTVPLTPSPGWRQETITFRSAPGGTEAVWFYLRFDVAGTGTVWLNGFWLRPVGGPEPVVALDRPFGDPLRGWASVRYWSEAATASLGYLREQARAVNPSFVIFSNGFHDRNVDYFMSEQALVPELDFYRRDLRGDVAYFPGVYERSIPVSPFTESVVVSNAFGYKYAHSRLHPERFAYHLPTLAPPPGDGPGGYYQNPDSALLHLAEVAAFGGGAGCDSSNLRYAQSSYPPIYTAEQRAAIRRMERAFWEFIDRDERLFHDYFAHADVAFAFHDLPGASASYGREEFVQVTDLARGLAEAGVLWDVLTEDRCNSVGLEGVRALVYMHVERLSDAEKDTVRAWLERGGLVFASGVVGDLDEWFRLRLPDVSAPWPPVGLPPRLGAPTRARTGAGRFGVGTGTLIYTPDPPAAAAVMAEVESHLGRTIRVVRGSRLRVNAWWRPHPASLVLHVLNYDVPLGPTAGGHVALRTGLEVLLPMSRGFRPHRVEIFSPEDEATRGRVSFDATGGLLRFMIPTMRIYTIVEVTGSTA